MGGRAGVRCWSDARRRGGGAGARAGRRGVRPLRRRRGGRPPLGGHPRLHRRRRPAPGGHGRASGSATSSPTRWATSRPAGPGSPGPGGWSRTSRRASSRAGWRSPRWAATSTIPPCCWPRPSWPSTGPAASATSTSRPRRSPTPGWPTCRPAGSPRAWPCSTRRWRWRAGRPTTPTRPASRCARSSPPATSPADFERAGSWADLLRQHGLIGSAAGRPVVPVQPLRQRAGHAAGGARPVGRGRGRAHPRQGRLRGGHARCRAGTRTSPSPTCASARAAWPRPRRCCSARTRRCRRCCRPPACTSPAATTTWPAPPPAAACGCIGDDRLRAVELLTVLVDAELAARRRRAAADAACAELHAPHRRPRRPAPCRRGPRAARARVAGRRRRPGGRDRASSRTPSTGSTPTSCPGCAPRCSSSWPACASEAGDRAAAALDAGGRGRAGDARRGARAGRRRACSTGSAARSRDRAPASRRAVARARTASGGSASCGGTSVRLPDTKGLRYLAELVARPGVERHVLDLVDRVEGVGAATASDRRTLGDAGEVLDARARAAYRRRIEAAAGARSTTPSPPASSRRPRPSQAELDQLVAQLAQAFGLGGREPAGRVGGRAGPAQRHPGAAGRHRQAGRGAARGRRGARPAGPHRHVLRLRARPTTTRSAGSFSPD